MKLNHESRWRRRRHRARSGQPTTNQWRDAWLFVVGFFTLLWLAIACPVALLLRRPIGFVIAVAATVLEDCRRPGGAQ